MKETKPTPEKQDKAIITVRVIEADKKEWFDNKLKDHHW